MHTGPSIRPPPIRPRRPCPAYTAANMSDPAPISSRSNPRVKQLRAALAGNDRLAAGLLAIEGPTLIGEALRSGIRLHTFFLTEGITPPPDLPSTCEVLYI